MSETVREEIARILGIVAKDGLNGPRDLDVALDAILCTVEAQTPSVEEIKEALPKLLKESMRESGAYLSSYHGRGADFEVQYEPEHGDLLSLGGSVSDEFYKVTLDPDWLAGKLREFFHRVTAS